jgi:hypothetical protein
MAGKRARRYDEGGVIGNLNYPFGQGQASSAAPQTSTGLGNNSPLVEVNSTAAETPQAFENPATASPIQMKKGGAVKSRKSSRGDGIAQRGRTKGRFV